ncbi:hypothetical protein [Candidatus Poriferisodalis sp.]|uniref:hypothetical protein n=1 Tax=Candidatus Poriferisodalis sp. TaxID=3101277 RepID=UPI003B016EC0
MGQFGPSVAAGRGLRRFADSGTYFAGVLASSSVFMLVADAVGGRMREHAGDRGALTAALIGASGLAAADGMRVWSGRTSSFGLSRQTPYRWRARGRQGVFAWGLDTGTPVLTVRATPLPMLGVILALTGHGGPLHGLFYGVGIVAGVAFGLRSARTEPRTDRLLDSLMRQHARLRPQALLLVLNAVGVAALALFVAALPR